MSAPGEGAPRRRFAVAAGIAMFVLAIIALAAIAYIPKPVIDDGLGPRLVPALVGAFLLLLAMGFTQAAWQGRVPDVADDPEEAPEPGGKQRVLWLIAGLIVFLALLATLGIVVASTAGFVLFARAFGSRALSREVAYGLIFIVLVWLLFDRGLGVQLGGFIKFGSLFKLG